MQGLEHLAQAAGTYFVSGLWQGFVLAVQLQTAISRSLESIRPAPYR